MSWDVRLRDPVDQRNYQVPHHEGGGTTIRVGYRESWLNVTYNYASIYRLAAKASGWEYPGMREWLQGRTAAETLPQMTALAELLSGPPDKDYWAPTPGNAGTALRVLLEWARAHPEGVWEVS